MAIEFEPHRFSADDYESMISAGILTDDDRVELLGGEIVEMPPIGPAHNWSTNALNWLFSRRLGERVIVQVQGPVRLSADSEPQPDVALLRPPLGMYHGRNPMPDEIYLLVEVADTSLGGDRLLKIPFYARSGIPEVWLVDLAGGAVERFRDAHPDGYRQRERLERADELAVAAFPDVRFTVEEILGPQGEA